MANKAPAEAENMEERVPILVQRIPGSKEDGLYVSVNGHDFHIKRGVKVMVPPYIKEVIEHSVKMSVDADSFIFANEQSVE